MRRKRTIRLSVEQLNDAGHALVAHRSDGAELLLQPFVDLGRRVRPAAHHLDREQALDSLARSLR